MALSHWSSVTEPGTSRAQCGALSARDLRERERERERGEERRLGEGGERSGAEGGDNSKRIQENVRRGTAVVRPGLPDIRHTVSYASEMTFRR